MTNTTPANPTNPSNGGGFRRTGAPAATAKSVASQSVASAGDACAPNAPAPVAVPDDIYLEPKDQLRRLVAADIAGKPFSELSSVAFDHRGAGLSGHVLLDTLEDAGYGVDDFDAVGALTAAAVPFACAMQHAAASRGEDLDAFVIDFVFPGIKGPSIKGRRVLLLDAWLGEKSYVQTSSLVTLRRGNELSLDFGVVENLGAQVVAVAALVGGARAGDGSGRPVASIEVVNPVDGVKKAVPFVAVYDEAELKGAQDVADGDAHADDGAQDVADGAQVDGARAAESTRADGAQDAESSEARG